MYVENSLMQARSWKSKRHIDIDLRSVNLELSGVWDKDSVDRARIEGPPSKSYSNARPSEV
jgi:hypothetical protein